MFIYVTDSLSALLNSFDPRLIRDFDEQSLTSLPPKPTLHFNSTSKLR